AVPTSPVEDRRQLSLRPLRILLPQIAEAEARHMGQIQGFEASYVLLVQAQELTTGGKIIVDGVKNLAIDSSDQASQDDRLCTVVDVREGYGIGAAQMQEEAERSEADPTGDLRLASAIDTTRSDYNVWDAIVSSVFDDDLLLLDLCKAISVAAELRMLFDGAGFVQAPRLLPVR